MSAASVSRPRQGRPSNPPGKARGATPGKARGARGKARPREAARLRWDRLGYLAMVGVFVVLAYLYLSAGTRMLSTWHQSLSDRRAVAALQREHTVLVQEHEALSRQGTIEGEARRLGMMKKGEQQYIVTGLPHD